MKFIERRKGPPEVPIIPMIDILSILLVFFIVYTERKTERPLVKIELVDSGGASVAKASGPSYVLTVSENEEIFLNGMQIPSMTILPEYLASFAQEHPNRELELAIDSKLALGRAYLVYAAVQAAGIPTSPLRVRNESKP